LADRRRSLTVLQETIHSYPKWLTDTRCQFTNNGPFVRPFQSMNCHGQLYPAFHLQTQNQLQRTKLADAALRDVRP
jgi:hypothetical protein